MKNILFLLIWSVAFAAAAQDPLSGYIKQASENNPGLQSHYAAFEASLERAAQVSGLPNPSLSVGYFIQPVETRVGPQQAKFSLSQMFPWFGSLSAKGDAVAAAAEARYLEYVDARQKLVTSVKGRYYDMWQMREVLELERENLRVLESYEELVTTQLRSGDGQLSSVYRVQMEIEEAETRISILQEQLLQLQQSFNRLLNLPPQSELEIADTLLTDEEIVATDSLGLHPAVAQFAQMKESAQYQELAAQKSGFPSLGLGLDYVMVGERSDMAVEDNGKDVVMPMVSLSLPIWRKQYRAAEKEAQLQQQQYNFQWQDAINELGTRLDMSLFKLREAKSEMNLYKEELVLARKTLELTITDYTNDREEFEEILRLQQKIIQYQKMRIKSYSNYLSEVAELQYLTYEFTQDENN